MAVSDKKRSVKRSSGIAAKKGTTAKKTKEDTYTDIRDVFGILSNNAVSGVFPPDASVTKLRYRTSEDE